MLRRDDTGVFVGRWTLRARPLLAALLVLASAAAALAQGIARVPSYRIFLTDGTPLVSSGEFTRSDGRVVFAMPVGVPSEPDTLQVVSLPEHVVDWNRTSRYADAVRLRRYASTRGEEDYLELTGAVARALSDMAFAPDAAAKLHVGEAMRRQLLAWPGEHVGYRASDVRDLTAIVEEALSDVRAGSGEQAFDLNLVATVEPPGEPLLPEPTLRESIDLASAAARASDTRLERMSLQSAIATALGLRRSRAPEPWMRAAERRVKKSLAFEARLDHQYADLGRQTLEAASAAVARGEVTTIERLAEKVRRQDARWGSQQPERVSALLASLASSMDGARASRLALDRWQYRLQTYAAYRKGIGRAVAQVTGLTPDLDAMRKLAGPAPRRLAKAERRISEIEVLMLPLGPPSDLRDAHEALLASVRLMREAVRLRRDALTSGSMDVAYNASSAAAGARLLFDSARSSLDDYFRRPILP